MQMGMLGKRKNLTFLHTQYAEEIVETSQHCEEKDGWGGLCQNMAYTTIHMTHVIA
jgi:hypothetical protein